MTTLDDCLSTFTVISCLRDPDGICHWRKMVDAYLDSIDDTRTAKANALAELGQRCRELRVDGEAAAELQSEIKKRLKPLSPFLARDPV